MLDRYIAAGVLFQHRRRVDVTVAQLVDAYGDAVSAAALARGTSRYDNAVANAAAARSALIAEIERLLSAAT